MRTTSWLFHLNVRAKVNAYLCSAFEERAHSLLVPFPSDRVKMGRFVKTRFGWSAAWFVAAAIVGLNVKLLVSFFALA